MNEWYRPRSADSVEVTLVSPGEPGWRWTGLLVLDLSPGQARAVPAGRCEHLVLPLSGDAEVVVDEEYYVLQGRSDVFAGPSDLVFISKGSGFTVSSRSGGRLAICSAVARTAYPTAYLPARDIPIEVRGAGPSTRLVRNFGIPGVLAADSLIACEVITPAGNWSSYPPHKHDEERAGKEARLEEIYYFEVQAEREGSGEPIGYQRVYGTAEQPIDVLTQVRSGDVVLVPHGWHGPSMAPPGYDLYYLNVMAGPGDERAWLICDDPAHAWVRDTWQEQPTDPRLVPWSEDNERNRTT